MVKAAGGVMHTDAVQAVGKIPIDVRKAAGGHAVALRPQAACAQGDRRAVHAAGHAAEAVHARRAPGEQPARRARRTCPTSSGSARPANWPRRTSRRRMTRVAALRDRLQEGLLGACPDARVNGDAAPPPAQHHQHQLRVHRGRVHPLSAERSRHLRPRPARPARPARWSRRTCCAPWACRSPPCTARSASA